MAPLLLCGFGLVFVLLRITSSGVDVVPDSIGLALYAVGMWRLAGNRVVLLAAAAMSALGAVLALSFFAPDWLHGTAEDVRDVAYGVAILASQGLGAWGLRQRARDARDGGVARQLSVIAVASGLVALVLVTGYAVNGADHDRTVAMIGSAGVVGLISTAWYAVLLMVCANRPWAQPVGIPTAPESETAPHMKEAPGPRS
jgi:hypothetical protein